MNFSNDLSELRRLAQQVDAQIVSQLDVIERMKLTGFSTAEAEEALRFLRRCAAEVHRRLKLLTAA